MSNEKSTNGPKKGYKKVALFAMITTFTVGGALAAEGLISSGTMSTTNTVSGLVTIPTTTALALSLTGSSLTTTTTGIVPISTQSSSLTTVPTKVPAVPATQLGINLGKITYWNSQRAFANLLVGSAWYYADSTRSLWWANMPADHLDANNVVKFLKTGERAIRILTIPNGIYAGQPVQIRCTYVGNGTIDIGSTTIKDISRATNSLTFTWLPPANWTPSSGIQPAMVSITKTDSSNPVRKLDCRETSTSPTAMFDPAFLQEVSKYKVARYMWWQDEPQNKAITWTTRSTPANELVRGLGGIPIETMVALANQSNTDPWFSIPWNADEDFVRRFATYVRDNLSSTRKVYVELSNEVWNGVYPVAAQARNEGLAAGLSTNAFQAQMFRYAQKTAWAMKIWTEVFAGQSQRLVRIASSQHANPWVGRQILSFGNTASYVDAYSTAPYFGHGLLSGANATATVADKDRLFGALSTMLDQMMSQGQANADLAKSYGKRFITYEAGQHIVSDNVVMTAALNRDPRMGQLYTQFLTQWKQRFGDVNTLFEDTSAIGKFGAFGMQEYAGQPASQAPKYAALVNFRATIQ